MDVVVEQQVVGLTKRAALGGGVFDSRGCGRADRGRGGHAVLEHSSAGRPGGDQQQEKQRAKQLHLVWKVLPVRLSTKERRRLSTGLPRGKRIGEDLNGIRGKLITSWT